MKKYFFSGLFLLSVSYFGLCQNIGNSDTLKDNSSWFSKSLEFKGIAVQDDDWQIWESSPIIGPEGKTHLFVARWPEVTGHQGWYTDSQIAHYFWETPEAHKQLPKLETNNNSIIEDGYAFSYGDRIYLVATDNHGMIENGGGLIWDSNCNDRRSMRILSLLYLAVEYVIFDTQPVIVYSEQLFSQH